MNADKVQSLCRQVLALTREELSAALPELGGAIDALSWQPETLPGFRSDGGSIFYCPRELLRLYARRPEVLRRGTVHILLHFLFLHPFFAEHAGDRLWDIACDLAVERMISGLSPSLFGNVPPILPELGTQALTAQEIYGYLRENAPAFDGGNVFFDDHSLWREAIGSGRRQKWEALLLALAGSRSGKGKRGTAAGAGQETWEKSEARTVFDYRRYLEHFSVLREEMQLDTESFDYAYYRLGMEEYQGIPFLEPPESQEVRRLEELVIAIDTSGSCSRETVSRFLLETWQILSSQENFFRKMNVYFIQCDCLIQDVTCIRCREDWMDYARKVVIQGRGGTDFTPVFDYIETLRKSKALKNLKALLYFTDGDGAYPSRPPDYETAFVLLKESGHPELIPKWAQCLLIQE